MRLKTVVRSFGSQNHPLGGLWELDKDLEFMSHCLEDDLNMGDGEGPYVGHMEVTEEVPPVSVAVVTKTPFYFSEVVDTLIIFLCRTRNDGGFYRGVGYSIDVYCVREGVDGQEVTSVLGVNVCRREV